MEVSLVVELSRMEIGGIFSLELGVNSGTGGVLSPRIELRVLTP